jgi:hypothetical protein
VRGVALGSRLHGRTIEHDPRDVNPVIARLEIHRTAEAAHRSDRTKHGDDRTRA